MSVVGCTIAVRSDSRPAVGRYLPPVLAQLPLSMSAWILFSVAQLRVVPAPLSPLSNASSRLALEDAIGAPQIGGVLAHMNPVVTPSGTCQRFDRLSALLSFVIATNNRDGSVATFPSALPATMRPRLSRT